MPTLAEVKAGAGVGIPVYRVKPYVILNETGMVLDAGNMPHILRLDDYYDDFNVEVRQYDLYMNDNTKIKKTLDKNKNPW